MLSPLDGRALRPALVVASCAALVMIVGCDRPAATIKAAAAAPTSNPGKELKNVMKRLEFALAQARPAAGSGVVSERRCSYQLHEPAAEGEPYTADVTIETSIHLATSEKVEPPAPADDDKQKADDAKADDDKKPADQATDAMPEAAPHTTPIGVTPETAAAVSKVEQKVYKLAYKSRRWELVEPTLAELEEGATDKYCLQYALSDG